ncbi:MAG: hypothetical protein ACR2PY_01245, partial [Salinispira sp.]
NRYALSKVSAAIPQVLQQVLGEQGCYHAALLIGEGVPQSPCRMGEQDAQHPTSPVARSRCAGGNC